MCEYTPTTFFLKAELETLLRDGSVTVDFRWCSRTIVEGEVKVKATCKCSAEDQSRRRPMGILHPNMWCFTCKNEIPHVNDINVKLSDFIPGTFVSVKMTPSYASKQSMTVVSVSERQYEVSANYSTNTFEGMVKITNFGTKNFEYHLQTSDKSTRVVTVSPFTSSFCFNVEMDGGSGKSTYVLKKPWVHGQSMSIHDWFSNASSTLLKIDFVAAHEMRLAFCMLLHARLGKGSTWSLSKDHVQMICTFV